MNYIGVLNLVMVNYEPYRRNNDFAQFSLHYHRTAAAAAAAAATAASRVLLRLLRRVSCCGAAVVVVSLLHCHYRGAV